MRFLPSARRHRAVLADDRRRRQGACRRDRPDDEGRADAAVDARRRLRADHRPRQAPADRARSSRRSPRGPRTARPPATPPTATRSRRSTPGSPAPAARSTLAPPKAYTPHAAGGGIDDYHCFVLDPKLKQDAFVTAALIQPQRTGIVHHVILYEAAGAQATAADAAERGERRQGLDVLRRARTCRSTSPARRCDRPSRPAAVDRRVGAGPHDERAARTAPACCCTRARRS